MTGIDLLQQRERHGTRGSILWRATAAASDGRMRHIARMGSADPSSDASASFCGCFWNETGKRKLTVQREMKEQPKISPIVFYILDGGVGLRLERKYSAHQIGRVWINEAVIRCSADVRRASGWPPKTAKGPRLWSVSRQTASGQSGSHQLARSLVCSPILFAVIA